MSLRLFKIACLIMGCLFLFSSRVQAQETAYERQLEVSLRMIGHQILLEAKDSTSRVLPILKEHDRYRIEFETEFAFEPETLVATINRVVEETRMAKSYIVEVEDCKTGELVYSFKMDTVMQLDIIPCKSRALPKSCYNLWFTLLEPHAANTALLATTTFDSGEKTEEKSQRSYIYLLSLFSLAGLFAFFLWKRRQRIPSDPHMIALGEYQFDKRNTELLIERQKIDLTSKEADLLLLLYNSANSTVEREVILNMVWGDEGGYVGRTLDVFISKLRKKLEFDAKVKIVNIRGVGYKLVLDD